MKPSVGLATDLRVCFYCLYKGRREPATSVVHDGTGCFPCCQVHARWRSASVSGQEHKHCPLGRSGPNGEETVTVLSENKK